jgi:hypothetical protein
MSCIATHALLFLLLNLLGASAIRSPACPGGCIIATQHHPRRECACVKETCGSTASMAASASSSNGLGPRRAPFAKLPEREVPNSPTSLISGDCGFCDRGYNTYASLADCYAAERVFQPKVVKSISVSSYPALVDNRPSPPPERSVSSRRRLSQSCPWPITAPSADDVSRTACPVSFPSF